MSRTLSLRVLLDYGDFNDVELSVTDKQHDLIKQAFIAYMREYLEEFPAGSVTTQDAFQNFCLDTRLSEIDAVLDRKANKAVRRVLIESYEETGDDPSVVDDTPYGYMICEFDGMVYE